MNEYKACCCFLNFKEVVVHGNFLQDIIDFFCNECMIDRKYIVSLNKLEKKKK